MATTATTHSQPQRADRTIATLLFLLVSSLYFATASGVTSSNDGSHYALTRTIVENHAFTLNQFDDYAEGNDIAIRDGRLYSDRPPGTALASAVFYVAAGLLPDPLAPLPSRHDAENPRLLYVLLLPVWAGTGAVLLLYLFMRERGVSMPGALTACLMLALGTAHWKYSTALFSHALSSFLIILSVWVAARIARAAAPHWTRYLLLGLILGYSVLVEYSNAFVVVVVGLYVLVAVRPFTLKRLAVTMAPFVMGGLVSALFLAYYNAVNFGDPFTLSYAYAVNYPWAGDFAATFDFPLVAGLRAMLIWGEGGGWCGGACYNQGLFLLSPVMLLALPGLFLYFRRARREFLLTTVLFLVYLLLFSKHHTAHGFTADGRYLVPFLGLLAIPLGFSLTWLLAQTHRPVWQAAGYLAAYGLFFLSLRNMFLHVGFSYNYTLDLSQLNQMIASPENWSYLASQVFRNTGNLPLLWLPEVVGYWLWVIGNWLFSRRRNNKLPITNNE